MSVTISTAAAIAAVRKNLDEVGYNESIMYTDESGDNTSLDYIVGAALPEAFNEVHLRCPLALIDAADLKSKASYSFKSTTEKTVIKISFANTDVLRLTEVLAADSSITVNSDDEVAASSPKGRMQANEYMRGAYDDPVLVRIDSRNWYYYSTATTPTSASAALFTNIKGVEMAKASSAITVSPQLYETVLDYLTGLVLRIYGEEQKAQAFFERAGV